MRALDDQILINHTGGKEAIRFPPGGWVKGQSKQDSMDWVGPEYVRDNYKGNLTWLPVRTIFMCRGGSHAYGLNTPQSDLDIRGVAIPPKEYFLGFVSRFDQAIWNEPDDVQIYSIVKYFQLAADANPNILELLFVDWSDIIDIHPVWREVIGHRKEFLSKKCRYTYSGYAHSQLKRIRAHRRWTLEPIAKPKRSDFGLPEQSVLSAEVRGAIDACEKDGVKIDFSEEVMAIFHAERRYGAAKHEYEQYEGWLKNRNAKRAALEREHGFDTKHAGHLVRLLLQCREILTEGDLHVRLRPDDLKMIIAVKNGEWKYDQLIEWTEEQDADMESVMQKSSLPRQVDRHKLDELLMWAVEEFNQ
jgi:hypothetical protein